MKTETIKGIYEYPGQIIQSTPKKALRNLGRFFQIIAFLGIIGFVFILNLTLIRSIVAIFFICYMSIILNFAQLLLIDSES